MAEMWAWKSCRMAANEVVRGLSPPSSSCPPSCPPSCSCLALLPDLVLNRIEAVRREDKQQESSRRTGPRRQQSAREAAREVVFVRAQPPGAALALLSPYGPWMSAPVLNETRQMTPVCVTAGERRHPSDGRRHAKMAKSGVLAAGPLHAMSVASSLPALFACKKLQRRVMMQRC